MTIYLCPDCMTESRHLKDLGVGDEHGRVLYRRVDEPGPNTCTLTREVESGRRTVERQSHWLYADLYCPVCEECYPRTRAMLGKSVDRKMAAANDRSLA